MGRSEFKKAFGEEYAIGCPLVFAGQLWHRVMVNRERPMTVSRSLGLSKTATVGVLKILRHCGKVPSRERLALIAMRVPDVTDEDVAEWFAQPIGWARAVRESADALRAAEPIPDALEYVDDGYMPSDPTPDEIHSMKMEIRKRDNRLESVAPERVEIRSYQWTGKAYAELPRLP